VCRSTIPTASGLFLGYDSSFLSSPILIVDIKNFCHREDSTSDLRMKCCMLHAAHPIYLSPMPTRQRLLFGFRKIRRCHYIHVLGPSTLRRPLNSLFTERLATDSLRLGERGSARPAVEYRLGPHDEIWVRLRLNSSVLVFATPLNFWP
jgi:hypothetical protein